jgi:hypothetical protein
MKENALRRFKFQELYISNSLRKYLSRAVDGENLEYEVENYSDITNIEEYDKQLYYDEDQLGSLLKRNLLRLPPGVMVQSKGLLVQEAIKDKKEAGL